MLDSEKEERGPKMFDKRKAMSNHSLEFRRWAWAGVAMFLLLPVAPAMAQSNIFLGTGAGASNTTGAGNVGVGAGALQSNTTGSANSAVGFQSLFSNTT